MRKKNAAHSNYVIFDSSSALKGRADTLQQKLKQQEHELNWYSRFPN